jgi:hypothetical protein
MLAEGNSVFSPMATYGKPRPYPGAEQRCLSLLRLPTQGILCGIMNDVVKYFYAPHTHIGTSYSVEAIST